MTNQFKELTEKFGLADHYTDADTLSKLERWCAEHVSQDLQNTGSEKERYDWYLQLVKDYLEGFLPHIPKMIDEPVNEFGCMNAIQYAADRAYNKYLGTVIAAEHVFNDPTGLNMTPLHLAATGGFLQTVKTLIARGAVPNQANQGRQFPLFNALRLPIKHDEELRERKIKIFKLLMAKAPYTVNAVDESGETIIHIMAVYGYKDLIRETVREKPDLAFQANNFFRLPIHSAILNAQIEVAKELLNIKGMNKVEDSRKRTPFHYAAMYGTPELLIACLVEEQDLEMRDDYGLTPLLLAAQAGNLATLQELIRLKASPAVKDVRGFSLLHIAALSGNSDLMSWVLDHVKLDVNEKDNNGHTALYCLHHEPSEVAPNSRIEALLLAKGAVPPGDTSLTN